MKTTKEKNSPKCYIFHKDEVISCDVPSFIVYCEMKSKGIEHSPKEYGETLKTKYSSLRMKKIPILFVGRPFVFSSQQLSAIDFKDLENRARNMINNLGRWKQLPNNQ